jgi:hypothetical protein
MTEPTTRAPLVFVTDAVEMADVEVISAGLDEFNTERTVGRLLCSSGIRTRGGWLAV